MEIVKKKVLKKEHYVGQSDLNCDLIHKQLILLGFRIRFGFTSYFAYYCCDIWVYIEEKQKNVLE